MVGQKFIMYEFFLAYFCLCACLVFQIFEVVFGIVVICCMYKYFLIIWFFVGRMVFFKEFRIVYRYDFISFLKFWGVCQRQMLLFGIYYLGDRDIDYLNGKY